MTEQQFEQCIRRMCAGEKDALREIYQEYIGYIYSIVYGIVQSKENAEDITSEFFIKLWTIAGTYKEGSGHRGWIATVSRNMALDFWRKQKREVLSDCFDEVDEAPDNPEQEVVQGISVKEAMEKLKPNERQVVDLKVLGEMTFAEIAELLGEPMGTITWRYQNAIKKLRRCGYE